MSAQDSTPTPWLEVRAHNSRPFYEAVWWDGDANRKVKRRIGAAWLVRDDAGVWRPRQGRPRDGAYNERTATVKAAEVVEAYLSEADDRQRAAHDAAEREARGPTFREVAADYLRWLENVKGAKPSTLRQHASDLAEPDQPYRRRGEPFGQRQTNGYVMRALGDRQAREITMQEVEALLHTVADTGVTPRTVNRVRALTSAVFNFGMRSTTYALPHNPAAGADRRREPHRGVLVYYSPEEVEAVARALSA